jgi:hypothetical protein
MQNLYCSHIQYFYLLLATAMYHAAQFELQMGGMRLPPESTQCTRPIISLTQSGGGGSMGPEKHFRCALLLR